MSSERSEEQFTELCFRWLEEQRVRLGPEDDPRPTLLLDTDAAREAGGLDVWDLVSAHSISFDYTFYAYVPTAILGSRAHRWAWVWAQWVVREPVGSGRTEAELSEEYARSKYLEAEGVLKPPAERPDRYEIVAVVVGTPEGETSYPLRVDRSGGGPPMYEREEPHRGSHAGSSVEPARQAVRMVASGEIDEAETLEEVAERFGGRLHEHVADFRRVRRPDGE